MMLMVSNMLCASMCVHEVPEPLISGISLCCLWTYWTLHVNLLRKKIKSHNLDYRLPSIQERQSLIFYTVFGSIEICRPFCTNQVIG